MRRVRAKVKRRGKKERTPAPVKKYDSLAALKALRSGELWLNGETLVLDNDGVFLRVDGVEVYDGGMLDTVLKEALDLLGIPVEDA